MINIDWGRLQDSEFRLPVYPTVIGLSYKSGSRKEGVFIFQI